jgi:hypothetical protein
MATSSSTPTASITTPRAQSLTSPTRSTQIDDSNIYWLFKDDFEEEGSGCVEYFGSFGLNMHLGTPGKKSKTECLFCNALPAAYTDTDTHDGADMSDINMGNGKTIQVVHQCTVMGNSSCDPEIRRRIRARVRLDSENKKQGIWIQICTMAHPSGNYETITLRILLYGCKSWTVDQGALNKLEAFNNAACRGINNRNMWHMQEYNITSAELLKRVGM